MRQPVQQVPATELKFLSDAWTNLNAGNLLTQFPVKKWHPAAFVLVAIIMLGMHLWYSQASVRLLEISQPPQSELPAVYFTIGPNMFPIEVEH